MGDNFSFSEFFFRLMTFLHQDTLTVIIDSLGGKICKSVKLAKIYSVYFLKKFHVGRKLHFFHMFCKSL